MTKAKSLANVGNLAIDGAKLPRKLAKLLV